MNTVQIKAVQLVAAAAIQEELAMPFCRELLNETLEGLRLSHLIVTSGALDFAQTGVQVLIPILLCSLQITKLNLRTN